MREAMWEYFFGTHGVFRTDERIDPKHPLTFYLTTGQEIGPVIMVDHGTPGLFVDLQEPMDADGGQIIHTIRIDQILGWRQYVNEEAPR